MLGPNCIPIEGGGHLEGALIANAMEGGLIYLEENDWKRAPAVHVNGERMKLSDAMVKVACGLSDAHTAQEDRYFDYRQAFATYTCHLSIGFNNAGISS